MDYSVTVIPVTKADKKIDLANNDYHPLNNLDKKNWEACESLPLNTPSHLLNLTSALPPHR